MIGLECIVVNLLDEVGKPEVAGRVDPSEAKLCFPFVILSEADSRGEDAAQPKACPERSRRGPRTSLDLRWTSTEVFTMLSI